MQDLDRDDIELILLMAQDITGAKIHRTHDSVLVQNVRSRILRNGCRSFAEYLRYLDRTPSEEPHFISALTIHTTAFFRELIAFEQFQKLLVSPAIAQLKGPFSLLSIGSSTGEELYSYGLILEMHRRNTPGFDYQLEAWDIDPVSLRLLEAGTYPVTALRHIPQRYHALLDKTEAKSGTFSPHSDIRKRVKTRSKNILEPPGILERFHFVSCRNLLIYFDQIKINKAITHMLQLLQDQGILCTGVSETVAIQNEALKSCGMPFFTRKAPAEAAPVAKPEPLPLTKRSRTIKTIAILEESRQHREQIGTLLREAGYDVLSSRNLEDIRSAVQNSKNIGLILLNNILLSGKSPLDFIKELRQDGYKEGLCLLANQNDGAFTERALAAGCNEVFLKPLSSDELLANCKRYLGLPQKRNVFYPDLIMIGASTGGTEVLVRMLARLPQPCPPVLVVQHISPNFAQDFAKRLAQSSGLTLGQIRNGERLVPGQLYMALHDYHIRIVRQDGSLRLDLNFGAHRNNHRPSVDVLFESALGGRTKIVACLLTGMGSDGAIGLQKLRQQGALTLVQDEASSVVFGMPREAIRLDAADFVGNPEEIRCQLNEILGQKPIKSVS